MVPEADYADARAEVARLQEQLERNSRMHEEAELLMFDELERLRGALKPFADIVDRMRGHRGESPLWAVLDECKVAKAVLNGEPQGSLTWDEARTRIVRVLDRYDTDQEPSGSDVERLLRAAYGEYERAHDTEKE